VNDLLRARLEELLGARIAAWRHRAAAWQPPEGVPGGTQRFALELADGRRAFVKHAADGEMAAWLRREQEVYGHLDGAPFMPKVLASDDGESGPLLVLEDLSDAHWPPPWSTEQVDAVVSTVREVGAATPPPRTPELPAYIPDLASGWAAVAADPEPFLRLALVDEAWLEDALPALVSASAAAPVAGDALMHLDVRGDNLCFRAGRVVLVDWNHACIGNPDVDVAFFAAGLAAEGGPQPDELLPDSGGLSAVVSGFFAARAGLPPPTFAPTVRSLQLAQLVPALAWTRRELGL
jgi:hypothetical protein